MEVLFMSSKLETKLLQYEKSTPISNDDELIEAIEKIISNEESVPIEERDFDLIDEAVEAILSLKKVDIEQLEDSAEKITDRYFNEIQTQRVNFVKKNKIKSVRLKWLIPIAAIISLLTVTTAVAYAFGFDIISMTKEAYTQLVEKVFYKQGNDDLIITNDIQEYDSLFDFMNNEDYSTLILPHNLSEEYKIESVYVEDYGTYKSIALFINCHQTSHEVTILTPFDSNYDTLNRETQFIGNYEVIYSQYDGKHQGEFIYEGNYYVITSSSYEQLKIIIESMGKQK